MDTGTVNYTIAELMVCTFAREIPDYSVGGVPGVRSEVPLAAVGLAATMHAPNLVCLTMAPIFAAITKEQLVLTGFTSEYAREKGAVAIFEQEYMYDWLHKGVMQWFFGGAMQIDQYADTNVVCIGDWHKPKVRGPGGAGLSAAYYAHRCFIWVNEHSKRVFVEKVDFISAAGPRSKRLANGYVVRGEPMVVSPLAVMDIDPATERLRLKSVHPGVSTDEVLDNTGFDLIVPDHVPQTQPPTEQELNILRTEVDPKGILIHEEPLG
ncbi:MAG: CoA synthetase [Clostridia bacterium]|nr:MAG: CoA synthetase [Clostridia bacterium]